MAECLSDTDNFVEEIEPEVEAHDSTSSCSTVSVPSLLSRLKSPAPSDLSLKTNPPKGMKHGKRVMPAESLFLLKRVLLQHLKSAKHVNGKKLLASNRLKITDMLKKYDAEKHPVGENVPDEVPSL